MSSQISDLFKRIKELEDQIQSQNDEWDKDYQNILDQQKDAEVKHDSLRTNISAQATKIDKINELVGARTGGQAVVKKGLSAVMGRPCGISRPPSGAMNEEELALLRKVLIGFGWPVPDSGEIIHSI